MAFDLKQNNPVAQAETGFEFEVQLPDGSNTSFFIKVRGDQSPTVKNHGRKVYNEMKMKEQMAKRKGKDYDIGLDEAEDMGVEAAVVRIIDWKGLTEDGKKVDFNKENATRVLKENDWIRAQVMEQSGNVFNFSSKSN